MGPKGTSTTPSERDGGSGESGGSRLDRELRELLEELRVILPGVEVLLAFLLGVAFTKQFEGAPDDQRAVYFVAFLSAALSSLLLLVPSVWHRLRWRRHDKEAILRYSNRCAIAGTIGLAVAVVAVVLLITRRVYGWTAGISLAACVTVLVLVGWYVAPLARGQSKD